ncbi:hypothetical protein [Streptomyces sp. ITFR-6]|uniref:hypothetical protein n=1 Tax=Streptomyces sp. ITFR-6 TaxID=3075197 RepID=UPI002889C241|nr:hypothetical protein [Streptomyces sp. ITFR-6]WNI34411.1 hypothetical protein RLT59_37975 [Streptomyces sp. ITFR-6]
MSAVAAPAAVLPLPRTESAGGSSRRRLRSVPVQAGPVVPLELGNPLQLSKTMRARLLAAVRALVSSPALADATDGARLASVVLTAKAKVRDDYQAKIWAAELGRWLGVSQSTVAHTVLPELRGAGFLGSNVATNAFGHATGLECWVIPMRQAQKAGDRRHALALSRSELAVLLSLCEVLFGPGWAPKDKAPIPAGLLAGRTGRGAATDRLGLLLMVLTTGSTGWLQLRPGSVDSGRGRPAATVGGLLGCTAAAGAKVLARLQAHGVADVVRQETGSGLNAKSRVRLVPVARAHGVAVREARRTASAVFSELAGTASGDLECGGAGETLVVTGVKGAEQGEMAGSADLAATAQHHALHASAVTAGGSPQLSCGFSGEGRGAAGRRPERVCVREDQAVDGETAVAGTGSPVAEGGPLRGEKPKDSPVDERVWQRAAGAGAGGRPKAAGWEKAQQHKRVALPADLGLRVALGPVSWLWKQLNGWQQNRVEEAARAELASLEGLLAVPGGAPRLLADRLADRLKETGGEALINKPLGWLIGRGLVRRPSCSDRRCDDGTRLDTGAECENCGNVVHIRRARRAKTAAQIERELPHLGDDEHRRVLEERLREQAAIEAEDQVRRREQARAEKARREEARAADQERAERERAAAAAADEVRQALACEDCGQQQAGGLCEACGYRRRAEALIVEAGMVVATWAADLADQGDVDAVDADVRASLAADIERARGAFLDSAPPGELEADPIGAAAVLAFGALRAVEAALPEFRSSALGRLARTEEADAEAWRAYKTEQRRRWFRHNPNGADAVAAATKAADTARERTAECLLAARLEQLREQRAARTEQAAAAPWTDRLPQLAARALDGDTAGAVIA